jgi:formylglycine-generating enzyme required for sulfatase activity
LAFYVDSTKIATRNVTVYLGMIENMKPIQPGTFMMGSPDNEPERVNDYETQHSVTLTQGFYMGKYPVTQAQYYAIMRRNDSAFPGAGDLYENRQAEFPVENLKWYEAIIFCNLLSVQEGFNPAYAMYKNTAPDANNNPQNNADNWNNPENWSVDRDDWGSIPYADGPSHPRWSRVRWVEGSDGYRLPTEAEWEYACRAGSTTPFNTGDNITYDDANYDGELDQTIPVGMYEPNNWGLYDMHGNVAEWCWDWFGAYPTGAQINPKGPMGPDTFRIMRGGSWKNAVALVRSAAQDGNQPYSDAYPFLIEQTQSIGYYSIIGFRVVRNHIQE